MIETKVEHPWSPPVHDIAFDRVDLPRYRKLYACTEPLAKAYLKDQLKSITDDSVAEEITQGLHALSNFLLQDGGLSDCAEGAALQSLDAATFDALRRGLTSHLGKSDQMRKSEDDRVDQQLAGQMAAELARCLWSTLLDHAAQFHKGGEVAPDQLLPTWPDPGVRTVLQTKLERDLVHFCLPLEALVSISHQTLVRLAAIDASAAHIQMPQRQRIERRALETFLEAQARKQKRAEQTMQISKPPSGGDLYHRTQRRAVAQGTVSPSY
jgi:hypothetical protein